jgi:hypothetical protein
VNEIVASPFEAVAVTLVGAFGTVAGVTALLVADAELVPILLLAVTVNVYGVPLVSPVTVIGEPPPVAVNPPIFEVTVYVVIADPPLETGGVKDMVAWPLPATAVTPVGAPGIAAGVTELLATELVLVPIAFVAVTENVYAVPLLRPVRVICELPPVALNPPTFEVTV